MAAFNQAAKDRYLTLIARGRMPRMAAEDIGFTWGTIRRHLKEDADFAEAMDEAQRRALEPIEEVLYDMALERDLGAIKEVLHNRAPEDWRDARVVQQQITGPGGGPVQIAAVTVDVWREVLTNPELREQAISMAREIPAIEAEVVRAT